MPSVTIIGTQWGDEGKGKIVDWLSSEANIVVRFQGGNNAGHTIQIDKDVYKLSLLPSGIVRNKLCMIGNGVVLDPWELKKEIETLSKQGIKINNKNLFIAENITLILPFHKDIDEINERKRGSKSIGTTKRGIGPAYEDKVGRRSVRLCDLLDKESLYNKIKMLAEHHNVKFKEAKLNTINIEIVYKKILEISKFLTPFSFPVWKLINESQDKDKKILFEGAQGSLLDIDFGTYPYVTSSNTLAGQMFIGSGLGINKSNYVLGITKAYTTRVGNGPFPTEINDAIGDYLSSKGKEFGTVTNRKRRCGWFDSILVRQSVILNGLNSLAITKLDVLDELENIKICVGYTIDDKKIDYFPSSINFQKNLKPEYIDMPGWKTSTLDINNWDKLPLNAKNYLKKIEELTKCKIAVVSTGPDRNSTILIEKPFKD